MGEKKRLVDSCELFFFVEPQTSGKKKSKSGLSRAQISVHRASAEVVAKSCLNWKRVDFLEKWLFSLAIAFILGSSWMYRRSTVLYS